MLYWESWRPNKYSEQRHDSQHDDTQNNNTQPDNKMQRHHDNLSCHYAGCRYADWSGFIVMLSVVKVSVTALSEPLNVIKFFSYWYFQIFDIFTSFSQTL
jgi:hypothetical protein